MAWAASDIVGRFAPSARPEYIGAFARGQPLFDKYAVVTPIRLAHFMAQCFHETGGLRTLVESGFYGAEALAKMWDGGNWHRYFDSRNACLAQANACVADKGVSLLSLVYGNRMGNGAPQTRDGWTYRGRGLLQTTGREAYRRLGDACGVAFEASPDLITTPQYALEPALIMWTGTHCNEAADNNDIKVITLAINGGLNGLDDRKAWFAKFWPFVTGARSVETGREWNVQEKLRALGYLDVIADGVVGPRTRAAILDYRIRQGLPTSPGITPDLLLSLKIP